jgi:hypothetical protein
MHFFPNTFPIINSGPLIEEEDEEEDDDEKDNNDDEEGISFKARFSFVFIFITS